MKTLIISEKDIAAGRIAKALSDDRAKKDKVGGVNVYDWRDDNGDWTCIGLRGHIITLDYPKELKRWSLKKLRDLVAAAPLKAIDADAKHIGAAIRRLSKDADRVIIATDYDREGELIGVEGLAIVMGEDIPDAPPKKSRKGAKGAKGAKAAKATKKKAAEKPVKRRKRTKPLDVKRARFSALTKPEVKRAFGELTNIDENLAASAEARQVVDLAWGAALTRFLSLSSGSRGEDFLSVGRVQSPTLALLVEKEKEIRAFVPEPYWEVTATLAKDGEFITQHSNGRVQELPPAESAHTTAAAAENATVAAVERKERTEKPPEPFNTTSFLRAATAIGFTAARAMSLAEDLYTNGWISYPRTDNTVYPPSLDLKETLTKFASSTSTFAPMAQAILDKGELKPTRGKKQTTDHPPITPYEVARGQDVGSDQWRIYELVVRRFFATLSDPAVVEQLKVRFDVGGEPFHATGRRLVTPGFRAVYHYSRGEDVILPQFTEGEVLPARGAEIHSKMTQPPKRYSQGKLIQEMENRNLGTKSTRADIIDKLYKRDYVRNNPPEPTETGFAVTETLEKFADLISKPDMTAALETEMDEVAEGDRELATVVDDSKRMLGSVLDELEQNQEQISNEIRAALMRKNTVGPCSKSEHPLIMRRARTGKRFVGCSGWPDCDETFPLPQFGKIVPERRQCPVCTAPVIRVIQAKKRPWLTCLTIECKGVEELEREERERKKAEKEAAAAADAGDGDADGPAALEPDPEDLGEQAVEDES